jgi:putative flippase GtrA
MSLVRQGLGFTAVGALQLLLDWAVMVALSAHGMSLPASNVAGRLAGASLGFWANRKVTFGGAGKPALPQVFRFLALWVLLTVLSTLALVIVTHHGSLAEAWLMKPLIEGGLAGVSFLTCRHWVYR